MSRPPSVRAVPGSKRRRSPLALAAGGWRDGRTADRASENVRVSLRLRNLGLTDQGREAPAETDGVHLFLRWKGEAELYVVSLNRRDDRLVIKMKLSGGEVNGGTYVTLGQVPYRVPAGVWQSFAVDIATTASGAVGIDVRQNNRLLVAATDTGTTGRPITGAGAVGLRGDNGEFEFDQVGVAATE